MTLYTLTVDDVANATVLASGDSAITVCGPLLLYCHVRSRYGSWLFEYSTATHVTTLTAYILSSHLNIIMKSVQNYVTPTSTILRNQKISVLLKLRPGPLST